MDKSYRKKILLLANKKRRNPSQYCELAIGTVFKKKEIKEFVKNSFIKGILLKIREVKKSGNLFLVITLVK